MDPAWGALLRSQPRSGILHDMYATDDKAREPLVWGVVVGYNHSETTGDCLRSLQQSDYPGLKILYVDNGSEPDQALKVRKEFSEIEALRIGVNEGPTKGFNVGLATALHQGADYVALFNNDTVLEPDAIRHMVERAVERPRAGVIIPKVNVYDHPKVVWSAGSRIRKFPPGMVMIKTRGDEPEGHRFRNEIDVATYCVAMFPAPMLKEVGLLDSTYSYFYEDYDHSLRTREAGYEVVLAERATVYHKVSITGGAGTNNPKFWRCYGSSVSVFHRKHGHRYAWYTGAVHQVYLVLRTLAEGHTYGIGPFLQGLKEGRSKPLIPVPDWDHEFSDVGPLTLEVGNG
jgi:GT2 family glycosyltransferase